MRLNHNLLPMIDYHKAKDLMWDPRHIDCEQDRRDWAQMSSEERDLTLRVGSLFLAGEEAVTHDLAPLLVAIRREGGHTEDEFFLTTQLFEEAKHMEFFDRWFDEVVGELDLASFLGESYAPIFFSGHARNVEPAADQQLGDCAGGSQCGLSHDHRRGAG